MKKSKRFIVHTTASLILTIGFSACKKFLSVPAPTDQVISGLVFTNDATATATISGIYSQLFSNSNQFSSGQTTLMAGLSADELSYYSGNTYHAEFIQNKISSINHANLDQWFWQSPYKYIYTTNLCIEQLSGTNSLSPKVKKMLLGEAKFIRAFCYFYLVNLFGDIPLELNSDYRINSKLARSGKHEVYKQIIQDLTEAQNLLSDTYPTTDRARVNKFAAISLLARVYLYQQDWKNAEDMASLVISNTSLYSLVPDLNKVFSKNSTEAIWQLQPVNTFQNTWEGNIILPGSANATPSYIITTNLLNAFENGDMRKPAWVTSRVYSGQTIYYPYKYKIYGNGAAISEYYMMLRLAEVYLIRAEARANQNNLTGAQSDLNTIRTRAGIPNTTSNQKDSLLIAIEHERQIELFAEWGHRWLDLKRTGHADSVLKILKPATWQKTAELWPIPQQEINLNPYLTQNPGY